MTVYETIPCRELGNHVDRAAVNVPAPNDRGPGPSHVFDREWLRGWAEVHKGQSPLARCVLELVAENERLRAVPDCSMRNEWLCLADDGCPHVEVA